MGCGAREVTLEVFESYLKKLLHMIDKLPSQDKDKAVMILKNSANQYYNLTLGQPLEYYHAPEPVASYQPSQLLETNTAAAAQQYETQAASKAKLESEAILAELSDLGANGQLNCLNEDNNVEQVQGSTFQNHSNFMKSLDKTLDFFIRNPGTDTLNLTVIWRQLLQHQLTLHLRWVKLLVTLNIELEYFIFD